MRATFQEIRLPSPDRSKEKYVSKRSCILCQLPCQFLVPTIPRRQKQPVVGILLYTQFKSFEKYVNRSSFLSKFSAKGLQRQNKYFFHRWFSSFFIASAEQQPWIFSAEVREHVENPNQVSAKKNLQSMFSYYIRYYLVNCEVCMWYISK